MTEEMPDNIWVQHETVDNPSDENLCFAPDGDGVSYTRTDLIQPLLEALEAIATDTVYGNKEAHADIHAIARQALERFRLARSKTD